MKTKITQTNFNSTLGVAGQLFSWIACLGAAILICSSAPGQNLFVSGFGCCGCETLNNSSCGQIFEFTWDGQQSIFASGLTAPGDVAIDRASDVFVVDYEIVNHPDAPLLGNSAVFKITPTGAQSIFASGLSHNSHLAVDSAGNLFVADYDEGIIYKYKPDRTRATFASGLHHPVGMAFDSTGNLFVADNSVGNIYQGSIYQYHPDGSRVTFAVLDQSDRPADLALDSMGNLFMADLGGNIYEYHLGILRRYPRTTFGSVPNSAQSLAFDSAGNLFVVDPGDVNGNGNIIYEFTTQAVRTPFVAGQRLGESFAYLAFQPQSSPTSTLTLTPTPAPRATPTPRPRPTPTPRRTATPTATPTPTGTGAPTATTNPSTNVASFSATLNGTVNPHSLTTTVRFQYGETTSYGFTTANQTVTGSTTQNVVANISGLTANTTYHFRIVASNADGTALGGDSHFTTLTGTTGPPFVTTDSADLRYIGWPPRPEVILNGTVDANGLITTVYFEYGRTTSYGFTTANQTVTGNTYQHVSATIVGGPDPFCSQHFRIVATNNDGTSYGNDITFEGPCFP